MLAQAFAVPMGLSGPPPAPPALWAEELWPLQMAPHSLRRLSKRRFWPMGLAEIMNAVAAAVTGVLVAAATAAPLEQAGGFPARSPDPRPMKILADRLIRNRGLYPKGTCGDRL